MNSYNFNKIWFSIFCVIPFKIIISFCHLKIDISINFPSFFNYSKNFFLLLNCLLLLKKYNVLFNHFNWWICVLTQHFNAWIQVIESFNFLYVSNIEMAMHQCAYFQLNHTHTIFYCTQILIIFGSLKYIQIIYFESFSQHSSINFELAPSIFFSFKIPLAMITENSFKSLGLRDALISGIYYVWGDG